MEKVSSVALDEIEITRSNAALVWFAVKLGDVLFQPNGDIARLGKLGWISRIGRLIHAIFASLRSLVHELGFFR